MLTWGVGAIGCKYFCQGRGPALRCGGTRRHTPRGIRCTSCLTASWAGPVGGGASVASLSKRGICR
eukprot:12652763-Alexandrium_andersonii.AAC.1